MKSKVLLLATFILIASSAWAARPASCFARAIQVVEETQTARVIAIADIRVDPALEGFDVFFMRENPAGETGVSRVTMARSSCTIVSMRTARTVEELDNGDLDEDIFEHN